MRRTLQIAGKELLQNRRDGLAALFVIVLPVVFTIFLGLIFGGAAVTTLPLAVVDNDQSAASEELVSTLQASDLLRIKETAPDDVEKAVKDQTVAAGLIIPAGFGASLDAGPLDSTADASVPLTFISIETSSGARSVQQVVTASVSRLNAHLLATRTATEQVAGIEGAPSEETLEQQAAALAEASLTSPILEVTLVDAGGEETETIAQGFDQSSAGGIVNWVLFGMMGVASVTVWERRQGLLRRLNVSGVKAREIVGGKMMAMMTIAFLQQLLLVLVGSLLLGVDYFASPFALILVMLSLSGLAASVGLLISVLFRSEQAVIATVVITAQLLAAMGGAWFPLEVTNAGFSQVAHVLPSAWVMDSLHGVTLRGWGVGDVLLPLAVVWGWIAVLFGAAVWRYRPE